MVGKTYSSALSGARAEESKTSESNISQLKAQTSYAIEQAKDREKYREEMRKFNTRRQLKALGANVVGVGVGVATGNPLAGAAVAGGLQAGFSATEKPVGKGLAFQEMRQQALLDTKPTSIGIVGDTVGASMAGYQGSKALIGQLDAYKANQANNQLAKQIATQKIENAKTVNASNEFLEKRYARPEIAIRSIDDTQANNSLAVKKLNDYRYNKMMEGLIRMQNNGSNIIQESESQEYLRKYGG